MVHESTSSPADVDSARAERRTAWGRDAAEAQTDLVELLRLRVELAKVEAQADLRSLRTFLIVVLLVLVLVVTALAACVPPGVEQLAQRTGAEPWLVGTLLAIGLGCVSLASGLLGYRRFRRDLLLFRDSLEEARDDWDWIRDWRDELWGRSSDR